MALQTLRAFVEKAKTDEDLQKQVMSLAEKQDKEGMAALMKEQGVSDDDLRTLREQEEALKTSQSDELSDEILEMVAGGGCWSRVNDTCLFAHVSGSGEEGCALWHTGL